MKWVFWKEHSGVRHMGTKRYDPPTPHSTWVKIMGVVARCEGNHDTVVSYDGTGITWGFLQWTFTSGRLQKLLQYMGRQGGFKDYIFQSLFDWEFVHPIRISDNCNFPGQQIFNKFGFKMQDGKFFDLYCDPPKPLNPRIHKKRINNICMAKGKYFNPEFGTRKKQAFALAKVFSKAGQSSDVAKAQINFAIHEFQGSLKVKRRPLKKVKTIENLLEGTWETPLPAMFFNLWQNSPKYAYKLFLKNYKKDQDPEEYFMRCWNHLKRSKFGNWSYAKPKNRSPRIKRLTRAILEFYGRDLPVK
ncbi:hypothetical protein N8Z24_00190 [bacterium]|nr:hypothetical protein [bacterium]